VVVIAGFALAACNDGGSSATRTSASTSTAPVLGPGTQLSDGLVVPKGAALLGRVFPRDGGWKAVLELQARGRGPFGAIVQQAEAAGFQADEPCLSACTLTRGDRRIRLAELDGGCGSVPGMSHIAITAEDTSGSALSRFTEEPLVEPAATRDESGTLLNPNGWRAAPVRLEAGSRLVGTPMASCEANGLHRSVVVLDRPATDIVSAYVRQWRAEAGPAASPDVMSIAEEDGHRLLVGGVDEAGGDNWTIHVIEEDGIPAYGLIESSTDP
jgi:hypothetical protein